MSLIQLKQLKKWILLLSLLLAVVVGQSAYAAGQSSYTALKQHEASSGGKGKDVFTLKKPKEVEATDCVVFIDAIFEYQKRRFGEAKIEKKPAKACNPAKQACKLTVDWRHAPAGRLHYRVKIKWDVTSSGC